MITIRFKFLPERLGVLESLLNSGESAGVATMKFIDDFKEERGALGVLVAGDLDAFLTPKGNFRTFLRITAAFTGGGAFEKAYVTCDQCFSPVAVERLIPPANRIDFYREFYFKSDNTKGKAYLRDNMELIAQRMPQTVVEYAVELSIRQSEFGLILLPQGAYDWFLRMYQNPNSLSELTHETLPAEGPKKSVLRLGLPLAPHLFWPIVTRVPSKDAPPNTIWVNVSSSKVIITDTCGKIQPMKSLGNVDIYYTDQLSAMDGICVNIHGPQQAQCTVIGGEWHVTLLLSPEELENATGLHSQFLEAVKAQIQGNKEAATALETATA